MNKGIRHTSGNIVGILNSDDFYSDSEVLMDVIQNFNNTNSDTLYADLKYVDQYNTDKVVRHWKSGIMTERKWVNGWMPPHPTFFVKSDVYKKYGYFNTELKSSADYELMLRFLYKQKVSAAYLPRVIVSMRTGGQSNANFNNRMSANKEDRKAWEINGLSMKWYTTIFKPLRKVNQYFNKG